ncbi:MAG: metal ABC transporter permease [Rubripirellula sp.]
MRRPCQQVPNKHRHLGNAGDENHANTAPLLATGRFPAIFKVRFFLIDLLGNSSLITAFTWILIDTWITLTACLAAAACAIPGCFLFLRKQSMIADALTHAALPGVVAAFVIAGYMEGLGWIDHESGWTVRQLLMFGGAMAAGLLTAYLTEWVTKTGWIRGDAALGVVFTTLFALGLILLRQFADKTDLDLDCVLYGQLETVGFTSEIPGEAIACGIMLLINVLLVQLLFKELMITTFDPQLAGTLGFRPRLIHYGLMTVTTATVVTAFEVVGSILVIGMLVIPPSTAFFITRRLKPMIFVSVIAAVSASILGHLAANLLPGPITSVLGLPTTESVRTSGAIVMVAALQMIVALLFGPERGILVDRYRHDPAAQDFAANANETPA